VDDIKCGFSVVIKQSNKAKLSVHELCGLRAAGVKNIC